DAGLVVVDLDGDGTRREGPDDVGEQLGRHHGSAVPVSADRGAHRDGEVEVAAGDLQLVAVQLESEPAQDGEGAAPSGDGSGGGVECLDKGITLATELHADSLSVTS